MTAPPSDPCTISVVIVSWNACAQLCECLESLRAQTDGDFEIVVVDNGSEDGTTATLRRRFPEVTLVELEANLGFAEGCNRGIAASAGAWIATLNSDTVVDAHWIETSRQEIRSAGEAVGMLQSKILFKERPELINSTGVVIRSNGVFLDRDVECVASQDRSSREVFCASAGAALYRRAMLEQTRLESGFFDRSYFMYFEDVDLGWRCRLAGWEARYVPEASVLHTRHGSARQRGDHFLFLHCAQNRLRTLLKNASLPFLVRCLPRTLCDAVRSLGRGGPAAVWALTRAASGGLAQRRAVGKAAVVSRREIERRWVERSRHGPTEPRAGGP
jgi:GT2 family glycosyltransferase